MQFPSWLQLGVVTCMPAIFSMLSTPSLAWEGAYEKGVKSGVCPATQTSPFDAFTKDAAVASRRTLRDSLPFDEEDADYDDDDTLEGGGKDGLTSLLSALVEKGGIADLGSKAGDILSGLEGNLEEGKEASALKEAMQGLSRLVGGGAGEEDTFKSSDIESLLKAAAGPLLSGGDGDFLDKLHKLVSDNSPEIKSLLDELVSNPYMDVEEISMPTVTTDVYTTKASANEHLLPDSLKDTVAQPVIRPRPVVLQKIKSFAEAPEELPTASEEHNGCHVLVLSGAGVKGAFQAGAVVGLAEQYKASGKQLRWDVVSGVSFGGVAAALSLPFDPGRNGELDYGRSLWSFWRNLRFEDVLKCKEGMRDLVDIPATLKWVSNSYKLWKTKDTSSTLGTAHPCDPSPYKKTLQQQLTRHLDTSDREKDSCADRRIVTLTAAIMGGGEEKFTFTSADIDPNCESSKGSKSETKRIDLVLTAMLATSAMPGIFPLVKFTSKEAMRKRRRDEDDGEDVRGQEGERIGGRRGEERGGEDKNARVGKKKQDESPKEETHGIQESLDAVTQESLLVDGSLTSYLNIAPAIKACQGKLAKMHRSQKYDGDYLPKKTAERKEHQQTKQGDELFTKDIAEGKGIVFDFIVANEVGTSATEENLEELFDSEDDVFDNAASPLFNINTLAESFPQARIRHVISYEDPAEVAHDVMDLRSVGALLEHGRVAGWKAATLKSIRAEGD
eukprot:XP_028334396.1 uncharacterized protein LOC114484168 [Physeter catodon]